jgi:hypothetical protein
LIEDENSSLANVGNYLRVLKMFSLDLGDKEFRDVSR